MIDDTEPTELEKQWYAAVAVGKAEMNELTVEVIRSLSKTRAYRISDDYVARHLWDEFSWFANEGDLMGQFLPIIESFVESELNKASEDRLVLLSAYSIETGNRQLYDLLNDDSEEAAFPLGVVSHFAIIDACIRHIFDKVSERNVALLGHDGSDEIFFLLDGLDGYCGELIDLSEVANIIHFQLAGVISAEPHLALLADEIAESCFEELSEWVSHPVYGLLNKHRDRTKKGLIDDILPALEKAREALLEALDPVEAGKAR